MGYATIRHDVPTVICDYIRLGYAYTATKLRLFYVYRGYSHSYLRLHTVPHKVPEGASNRIYVLVISYRKRITHPLAPMQPSVLVLPIHMSPQQPRPDPKSPPPPPGPIPSPHILS